MEWIIFPPCSPNARTFQLAPGSWKSHLCPVDGTQHGKLPSSGFWGLGLWGLVLPTASQQVPLAKRDNSWLSHQTAKPQSSFQAIT